VPFFSSAAERLSTIPLKSISIGAPLLACSHKGSLTSFKSEGLKSNCQQSLLWQAKYPKLCEWVENNIEETFGFYRLPKEHHKHLKSTNVLERLNQELKRRTHVIRIFPNEASSLRLLRALAVEIHEDWLETPRYLNMEALREQRKTEVGYCRSCRRA
jgi:transposase-like protein